MSQINYMFNLKTQTTYTNKSLPHWVKNNVSPSYNLYQLAPLNHFEIVFPCGGIKPELLWSVQYYLFVILILDHQIYHKNLQVTIKCFRWNPCRLHLHQLLLPLATDYNCPLFLIAQCDSSGNLCIFCSVLDGFCFWLHRNSLCLLNQDSFAMCWMHLHLLLLNL